MVKQSYSLARLPVLTCALALFLASAVCLITISGQNVPIPPGAVALDSSVVSESSGLARSRLRDDLLWTHNDSGDSPRLFAFSTDGHLQAQLTIEGATAIDWEDMCTFTRDGANYMAVADVGDNLQARRHVVIYVIREPQVPRLSASIGGPAARDTKADRPVRLATKAAHEIRVRYPDGALNCEAIAYDPWRQEFLLATKESLRSRIYVVSFDTHRLEQETTARHLSNVILPLVTGASISDDGQLLALATYGPTCLLRRAANVDWANATKQQKKEATWRPQSDAELELVSAPPRRQGESVCFDRAGTGMWLTSEGAPMLLLRSEIPSMAPGSENIPRSQAKITQDSIRESKQAD